MNVGKAIAVFKTLENEKWSDSERINALCIVAEMPTINSIKKDELQKALKWILDQTVVEVEESCVTCAYGGTPKHKSPCSECANMSKYEKGVQ